MKTSRGAHRERIECNIGAIKLLSSHAEGHTFMYRRRRGHRVYGDKVQTNENKNYDTLIE